MKKNKILLLVFIVLAIITVIVINKNRSGTIKKELSDFAVNDTASITKIFLADRTGQSITFKRNADMSWTVNDSFPPKPDMMLNLIDVIRRVQVKTKVPKAGYNNVITNLASYGTKCEIYINHEKKPFKIYYVGSHTADLFGTFMMIENSSVPFVTEIPGFNGYLSPRFNTSSVIWREPIIFRERPEDISTLTILYPAFPQRSFKLERKNTGFILSQPSLTNLKFRTDSVLVDNYLQFYNSIYYEFIDGKLSPFQKDSLLNTNALCEIKLEKNDAEVKMISVFPMAINETSLMLEDSLGNPLKYDLDRMYGFSHHNREWLVIQHYSFDKLFRSAGDFLNVNDRKLLGGKK